MVFDSSEKDFFKSLINDVRETDFSTFRHTENGFCRLEDSRLMQMSL